MTADNAEMSSLFSTSSAVIDRRYSSDRRFGTTFCAKPLLRYLRPLPLMKGQLSGFSPHRVNFWNPAVSMFGSDCGLDLLPSRYSHFIRETLVRAYRGRTVGS